MRITWLNNIAEISALKEPWERLESSVRDRTVFSTFDYVLPWYRHYSGSGHEQFGEPLLGAAWQGNELLGIAPFTSWRGTLGRVPVNRVDFAGFTSGAGEFLVPDDKHEVIAHFIDSLVARGGFDILCLNSFAPASGKMRILCDAVKRNGLDLERVMYRYAMVDLKDGYEAYSKRMGGDFRRNLRRHERKVHGVGNPQIETFKHAEKPEDLLAPLSRMLSVYNASWKVTMGGPLAEHHRRFYEEIAFRFARRGMLHLVIMSIDSNAAAFFLALSERETAYDIFISFAELFKSARPGEFLTQQVIKELPKVNIHALISHGDHPYKNAWASHFVPQTHVVIFNRGLRAHMSRFVKFSVQPVVEKAKENLISRISVMKGKRKSP